MRGNKLAKATGEAEKWPTKGGAIKLQHAASLSDSTPVDIAEFSGIISVEYAADQNKSTVSITGDETSY